MSAGNRPKRHAPPPIELQVDAPERGTSGGGVSVLTQEGPSRESLW